MKDRFLWIIFAIISFGFFIPISLSFHDDWEVFHTGNIVKVTIISLPGNYSVGNFMDFKLNGHLYHKKVDPDINKFLHVGEKINIKFLNGYEDSSLFPNENPFFWNICVMIIMFVLGLSCLYYAFRRNPVPFRLQFTSKRSSN
jgi:hypothetical protein